VNNLPKVVTQLCPESDLNPQPVDRKSNAPPVAPPRDPITSIKHNNLYLKSETPCNKGLLESAASSHGLFHFARNCAVRFAIRELGRETEKYSCITIYE